MSPVNNFFFCFQIVVVFYVAIVLLLIGTNLRAGRITRSARFKQHVVEFNESSGAANRLVPSRNSSSSAGGRFDNFCQLCFREFVNVLMTYHLKVCTISEMIFVCFSFSNFNTELAKYVVLQKVLISKICTGELEAHTLKVNGLSGWSPAGSQVSVLKKFVKWLTILYAFCFRYTGQF